MIHGHYAIEDNIDKKPNFDGMWKDYKSDPDSKLENLLGVQGVRALYFTVAQIAHIGVEMASMFYPYGMIVAVIVAILALAGLGIFMYPILFVYVLLDERKMRKQNYSNGEIQNKQSRKT